MNNSIGSHIRVSVRQGNDPEYLKFLIGLCRSLSKESIHKRIYLQFNIYILFCFFGGNFFDVFSQEIMYYRAD